MGRIRDTIIARLSRNSVCAQTFGEPAEIADIEAAETALGLKFPDILRELYQEFDGLWFGEPSDRPFYDNDNIVYFVLPLRFLLKAKKILIERYGRAARNKLIAQLGSQVEKRYEDFEGQLNRCVPFKLGTGGDSFKFLTDLDAWEIEPGRVGSWEIEPGPVGEWGPYSDRGVSDSHGPLIEYLAEWCRAMS